MTLETLEIHLQGSSEGLRQELERVALIICDEMLDVAGKAGHTITEGLFRALLVQAYETARAMYDYKIEQSRKAEAA